MAEYLETEGLKLRRKVRAVVLNEDGEVLLIRPHGYPDGEWTLAGGGVEMGESPVEAMRRELAEELGVELEAEPTELPVTNRFVYSAEHKAKRRLDHDGQDAAMFACRISKWTPLRLQAEEVAEARWFAVNEAADAFPVAKQREVFLNCLGAIG
jgi:8-oxo-dGTP pyrophosphatase MutT (NUDIX family)